MATFLDAHRGPFRFCVSRPSKKKAGFFTTEWLTGTADREDIPLEAMSLLEDPRDNITWVGVWSETEQAFIGAYTQALVKRVVEAPLHQFNSLLTTEG